MTKRIIDVTDALYDYIIEASFRDHPVLAALRAETKTITWSGMQISRDQGQFMGLLAKLIGARCYLEVGTYTGYSALAMALAVPDLELTCLDVSEEWTAVGQRYWQQAGVAERIDLRLAPALESLAALEEEGRAGSFDICFIDADKENQANYYEAALRLLRPGGLIAVDNVLWDGAVIDPADQSIETAAIRAFNDLVKDDRRVDISLLAIGDGLTLARKRP